MPSTIRDLTELTTVASDDYLLISDTSDVTNRDKRISRANLFTGFALRTGTPVTGRVASWADAFTLQDGGFALTDISRLSVAQTSSALKTFSAGISVTSVAGSFYEEGTWTPVVADASSGGNLASGTFSGQYQRIGNVVTLWASLVDILITGMTTTNPINVRGLPYPARTLTNYVATGVVFLSRFNLSLYVVPQITSGNAYMQFVQVVSGSGGQTAILVSGVASSGFSDVYLAMSYLV